MMIEKMYRKTERITGIIVLLFSLLFFLFWYPYHLFFTEQMQLFLLTPGYFMTYLSKPAVLARYIGDFLTQFYYLRGGGAIVITINILVIWLLMHSLSASFLQKKSGSLLLLLPAVVVFALHTNVSYSLASTVAVNLVLALLSLLFLIKNSVVRRILEIILVPFIYWATGGAVLLFSVVLTLFELTMGTNRKITDRLFAALPLLFGLLTPILLRKYFLLTKEQAFLFPAAHFFEMKDWALLLPTIIILIVLILLIKKSKLSVFIVAANLAILIFAGTVGISKNVDFKLEKILAIDSELYFNHIKKASELSDKYQIKGSVGTYFRNLIASIMNRLPEEMTDGNQTGTKGLFLPVDHNQSYINIVFSNEIYYYLGDVNASQHSALLGMIFSPKSESSRLMRRLVEINIINREYAAAEKFIKILEKSMFHKKWAVSMRKYLYHEKLCEKTLWIKEKRDAEPLSDDLKETYDIEKTLQLLLERDPENKAAFDYLCCYYLFEKEIGKFANLYLNRDFVYLQQIPPYFQEALLLWYVKDPKADIWQKVKISSKIATDFKQYSSARKKNRGNGKTLQDDFKKTYWFYYNYAIINNE